MEPITVAIATALGLGLGQVAKTVVEEGAVKPALKPATDKLSGFVQRGYNQVKADQSLQQAVQKAFAAVGAPESGEAFRDYALRLGFDQLQAADNHTLREEIARAALLLTAPDPQQLPENLLRTLRWPRDSRPILAQFLYALRQQLAADDTWKPLVEAADQEAVRVYLREATLSLHTIEAYFHSLLTLYGLAPDKPDAQALQEYIAHVAQHHQAISFLFIKPAGRRDRLRTEAELETVFVPLQVADLDQEERHQRRTKHTAAGPDAMTGPDAVAGPDAVTDPDAVAGLLTEPPMERERLLTIDEVLARYPIFLLKGTPGSGKTTLLRHLALCFARGEAAAKLGWQGEPVLPILLPLRNFGRFLQDHRAEYTNPAPQALRHFMEDYFREYDLELPQGFFRQRLQQGHCLVLLDGLDEVANRDLRVEVARVVDNFIKEYAPKGNRFGLASRPRGYEEVARYLPRPVICTVQNLLPESRDQLVYNLLRQFVMGERECQKECRALLQDIRNKPRVNELSRNPLFCTTLVLVYKYRGAALPERRVDVYQELVTLMLGFWETHREGVADVRELALMDGTGRSFMDEGEAVEAKERALIDLADWMQHRQQAEVGKAETETHLADYFEGREGANEKEKETWAKGFLSVAHQRSGLFVEVDPETYAFSHQNFREYLAATALMRRTDKKMIEEVLAQAGNSWWEEVILLAAAHKELSPERRESLLEEMMTAGHLVLTGWCAVDAGARLPAPLRRRIQERLYEQMTGADLRPKERFAAGEALDALGWLPPDLNNWIRCPACADNKQDLWVMKYPVTNAQYELFIEAGGYENPRYWGGEQSTAWQWRIAGKRRYSERGTDEPEHWQSAQFGKERHGFPVVGVSWYEVAAYAAWVTELLQRVRSGTVGRPATAEEAAAGEERQVTAEELALVVDLLAAGVQEVRLPTETEWVKIAGGDAQKRYPWDKTAHGVTKEKEVILARANTDESKIRQTSPVGMYPQGRSEPFGLMDLAGNVWEWTDSWRDKKRRVVRGSSWLDDLEGGRVAVRYDYYPDFSHDCIGFRLVSPVVSGF